MMMDDFIAHTTTGRVAFLVRYYSKSENRDMANIEMCEMTVVYHCVALNTVVAHCIVSILQVKDLGFRASLCWKLQSPALVCCTSTDDSGCRLPTVAVAITTMQKRIWLLLLLSRKHSSSSGGGGGKLEALF